MALLIYSRSPYLMTLGKNTIPRPVVQFVKLVAREGVKGAWTLFSVVVGAGAIGAIAWVASSPVTAVLLAVAALVFLVLAIGSYRCWLAAARFIPNLAFEAQRRADTLNAWKRSRQGHDRATLMNYQAMMVQDALIDFDRFKQLGALDDRATRDLVANPQTAADIDTVIALFQDVADRAKAS